MNFDGTSEKPGMKRKLKEHSKIVYLYPKLTYHEKVLHPYRSFLSHPFKQLC